MEEEQIMKFTQRVRHITNQGRNKLEELKANYKDLERKDFLWHYLLESFSTMGNSRGKIGLIQNLENYNLLKFEYLESLAGSRRLQHIATVCWNAKIRMPDQKAKFINSCFLQIRMLGGPGIAKDILLSKDGRNEKINFLREFSGIGPKYARNIMMDVYHEDFRNSIAIDSRIKKILASWNYNLTNYITTELFLLDIANKADLNGWELDRLMYNFENQFINWD